MSANFPLALAARPKTLKEVREALANLQGKQHGLEIKLSGCIKGSSEAKSVKAEITATKAQLTNLYRLKAEIESGWDLSRGYPDWWGNPDSAQIPVPFIPTVESATIFLATAQEEVRQISAKLAERDARSNPTTSSRGRKRLRARQEVLSAQIRATRVWIQDEKKSIMSRRIQDEKTLDSMFGLRTHRYNSLLLMLYGIAISRVDSNLLTQDEREVIESARGYLLSKGADLENIRMRVYT